MKITFIGHASILIETNGITILSDPWWKAPCFGAQWWNYPEADTDKLEGKKIDYVYVSHGHHDHYHQGTLRTIDKDAKVLVSKHLDLTPGCKRLGFDVIEVDKNEEIDLGNNVKIRIMPTHGDDTLMSVHDGNEVLLNLNDSLHSAPASVQNDFIRRLNDLFPSIDYVFCGFGVASHFPNCYVIPGKDYPATAIKRQKYFNQQWVHLIHELSPKFGFPFAADVGFFEEDLLWVNEPTHNGERPIAAFKHKHPNSNIELRDIAPGFEIDSGNITNDVSTKPVSEQEIRETCKDKVLRANNYGSEIKESQVQEVAKLLNENLKYCEEHLRSLRRDYGFFIEFRNSAWGIVVEKNGDNFKIESVEKTDAIVSSADVVYLTRLHYLRRSLTHKYGDEILFVGSGGIFKFKTKKDACENLHWELKLLITRQTENIPPRPAPQNEIVKASKNVVKKILGKTELDLYDLAEWTVFKA